MENGKIRIIENQTTARDILAVLQGFPLDAVVEYITPFASVGGDSIEIEFTR